MLRGAEGKRDDGGILFALVYSVPITTALVNAHFFFVFCCIPLFVFLVSIFKNLKQKADFSFHYFRLGEEQEFNVLTAKPAIRLCGEETTTVSPFATRAVSTSNFTM